jgi:hypothetical protein
MMIMRSPPQLALSTPRRTWHWAVLLLAWALAAAWGSVVQTQWNVQALVDVGVPISASERAQMTWQDLMGFAPVYGGILAVGWLLALPVASWLARSWPAGRSTLLAAAAGVGMVAAVRTVDAVAPMPVFIDATRSLPGLVAMAAGAALAGWLYARLTART